MLTQQTGRGEPIYHITPKDYPKLEEILNLSSHPTYRLLQTGAVEIPGKDWYKIDTPLHKRLMESLAKSLRWRRLVSQPKVFVFFTDFSMIHKMTYLKAHCYIFVKDGSNQLIDRAVEEN